MKTKTRKMLPKITDEISNGGIYLQHVRCGKQSCKCARGELHSAYYFFTRRNGKLIKLYIRKAEFSDFCRLVTKATIDRIARRQITKENNQLLRQLRQFNQERNALINSLKGE